MSLITAENAFAAGFRRDVPAAVRHASTTPTRFNAERGDCWLTLPLRHADARPVCVSYESIGSADAPCVVVLGGISAHRHLTDSTRYAEPGWWSAQVGIGCALDPRRLRLLSIDWLGARGELDVPLDTADQADALAAVLDALGIRRVHAVIGASYGAQVGLQFAARHGERLRCLLAISGAHRPHPFASAWRSVQRAIVRLGGDTTQQRAALAVARQLAVLSYRSPEEFAARFDAPAQRCGDRFEVAAEPYLCSQGERFSEHFNATAYQRLSESIDLHRVDPNEVRVPTTIVGVHQDRLVPLDDLRELARSLAGPSRLVCLQSPYGHDAFLKEHEAIARLITQTLCDVTTEVAA
jgi:homoserine O-acetyltransferase